ncbi:hypothetical protein [Streptomyces chilikensis]|uniref:Integral membrane protein n=1 Tax=Streptomyces chilikensis TaxID=1194079 RepID=A0ABV3EVI8_9ACTN
MTYAPHAPRGSLPRPPGTWHPGSDLRRDADLRLLGDRGTKIMKWALPLVLGLLYGAWAATNSRHGGPVTGWNLIFGFVTALVFMLALMAMRAFAPRLPRGIRAAAWAAFAGIAVGFLVSASDGSLIRSLGVGVAVAAGVFVSVFYRVQTRRTPGAHGTGEPRYPVSPREDEARTAAYASGPPTTPSLPGAAGGPAGGAATAEPAAPAAPATPVRHGTLRRRRRGGKARHLVRTIRTARSTGRRR